MSWTLPSLLSDVMNAWSPQNLPYTLAFWAVVGAGAWFISKRKTSTDEPSDE